MASRRLIWHLFPAYLLVLLVALAAALGYSARSARSFHLAQVEDDLSARAALLSPQVLRLVVQGDKDALQTLCADLGVASRTRITVILPDGSVVADSSESPSTMDNHAQRPEIRAALARKTGVSTRFSRSLRDEMMYVALPLEQGGAVAGVVRVAVPLTIREGDAWPMLGQLMYGAAAIALVAALVSWFMSRRIGKPLTVLGAGAERFGRGDFAEPLRIHHSREIDSLAETMNRMAAELETRIETAMRQKGEQAAILASMVEGVLAVDNEGRVISVNAAAAQLFETDRNAAPGKRLEEIVRNSDLQNFMELALGTPGSVEREIVFHLDSERTYQAHGANLRDPEGETLGAIIVLHDVTELRRLETIRSEFVSNVSHELRTPVTSIKGFVETLIDAPPEDEEAAQHFLRIVLRNVDQLNSLIGDLLSLSRIEQGELSGEEVLEICSVDRIVKSAVNACKPAAGEKGVTVESSCDLEDELPIHPTLLQQAVANLVDNAVKYSVSGQRVEVTTLSDNGEAIIRVADHGAGIAARHLPRLFERFYRVDQARSRELGGTGLGLAIVKHIAELHGGRVLVESEVGVGSTFEIRLPRN